MNTNRYNQGSKMSLKDATENRTRNVINFNDAVQKQKVDQSCGETQNT